MPRSWRSEGYAPTFTTLLMTVSQHPLFPGQVSEANLCLAMRNPETSSTSNSEDFVGATPSVLKQLDSRLTQWRGMLPSDLQWSDKDPAGFPGPQKDSPLSPQPLDPELSQQRINRTGRTLFTADLDQQPEHYLYLYDVQVALLRTRYYYAKYMVYRPFIFKALHYPEMMSQQDAEGVAECLRVRSFSFVL